LVHFTITKVPVARVRRRLSNLICSLNLFDLFKRYFTETQTIPGDTKGHLFPIMMKADELKSVMLERVGPPKNSGF
jgi:hypothetical protein